MRKKIVPFLIMLFVLFGSGQNKVLAEEESGIGSGFSKRVIHPENQIKDGEALDLLMKPGQKQTVPVEIKNYRDRDIVIGVEIAGARTNGEGVIEYGPSKFEKDETLKYDLTDLVKVPSEITVKANSVTELLLEIEMPKTAFEGTVTGGVVLTELDGEVDTKDESGTMIKNKIAFLFGITLRNSEAEVAQDFAFRGASAGLENYRNTIYVDVANTKSTTARDMTLTTEITKKGKSDVLYQRKKSDIAIAPNSILSFPISLEGSKMIEGKYTAHTVLKGYDREWQWSEDFEITKEEADKFNQQDPYLVQERGLNWKIIIIVVVSALTLGVVIFVVGKVLKKKQKKNRRKQRNRK